METYVECMVKKKANGLMSALKVLLIGIAVITGLLGFMGLIVFLIIAVVAGVGAYFVSLNANLEYEYLYVDKQLTVDKIMARTRRKKWRPLTWKEWKFWRLSSPGIWMITRTGS